jgi:hypothetical protein
MGNPIMVEFQEVVHGVKKNMLYLFMEYAERNMHCIMGVLIPID